MKLLQLALLIGCIFLSSGSEDTNTRGKRQQLYFTRRGGRPPPYAVQMEPIVQYSQRDPFYNPLAHSKSDDFELDELSRNPYGTSQPEPIIEIIIKESNESLPTPAPSTLPQQTRPAMEPIQVFYVKYENKDQPDGKSKVVYDTPVPALTPHEKHEEIKSENPLPSHEKEPSYSYVTPAPQEPSTTLRAIIRPDSEVYHSGSSGIRVTFGTEELPPNNHNKRSDVEGTMKSNTSNINSSFSLPSSSSSKRQHGPFPPVQGNHVRVSPAFPQQRIVNSFPPQHQLPPSFNPQKQFQSPPPPHLISQRQQRPPITIQGLPEVQQRLPFQSFNHPHRIAVNHPQQSGFPPVLSVSHQNIHPQNQPPPFANHGVNFNDPHSAQYNQQQLYKQQQDQEKQRYHDQRRQQELFKQREQQSRQQELQRQQEFQRQQDIQRQQEAQKQQEIQRQQDFQKHQLEQQRIKENKLGFKQQQQQQQNYHQNFGQQQIFNSGHNRIQQQQREEQQKHGEILKAVPKLEQHYAIRENPLHPGPFPPNPQTVPFPENNPSQFYKQQSNSLSTHQHNLQHHNLKYISSTLPPPPQSAPSSPRPQGNEQYFSQNLAASHQQRGSSSLGQSIWGQNVYKDIKQTIYATPATNNVFASSSTLKPVPTSPPTPPSTTTTTTETPTLPQNQDKIKANIANLPDEVPEDIREQLLSSGILGNADIQVLDYDKIGDIPIENLPPEHLANFYGAGGGAVSASEPVPSIAKNPKNTGNTLTPKKVTSTKVEQATLRPGGVEMKVVRFDPNTAQGQAIADQHIREDATQLKPVTVGSRDDGQYNRYLPLKVSGTSFPIPDVPELKDRKISSVVVLAPVDYHLRDGDESFGARQTKKLNEPNSMRFLAGESLKLLVKKPTAENYKKWLEQESRTAPQKQSVVLLVTTSMDQQNGEKEIFMYDVTSQSVSKLSGDLSSAFVDAAESNSETPDTIDDSSATH